MSSRTEYEQTEHCIHPSLSQLKQSLITLTFNRQAGQSCPNKCTSFLSKRKNDVPQWVFKYNSAPTTAKTYDLKGCTQKVIQLYSTSEISIPYKTVQIYSFNISLNLMVAFLAETCYHGINCFVLTGLIIILIVKMHNRDEFS